MTEYPIRPHDLEVLERLTRMEQKIDSHLTTKSCDKHTARLAAIEQKLWIGTGALIIIGAFAGYVANKLPLLQMIASGATP